LADWTLQGPITSMLAALCVVELATWAPHYLTWPWWADSDVFATMARSWSAGILPYRDFVCTNFPGETYLFWALGRLFGWGRISSFYAFDVALLLTFGGILTLWSRRLFGRALPGLLGYAIILSYYLRLDFTQVAQRDWHVPLLAVGSLCVLQAWAGRWRYPVTALVMAFALSIRPQAILFLPAMVLALDEGNRRPGEPWARTVPAVVVWGLLLVTFVGLAFFPLARAGVLDDFIRSIRQVTVGSTYNKVKVSSFWETFCRPQDRDLWLAAPVLLWLSARSASRERRAIATWLVAMVGVMFYRPLSPSYKLDYLEHPSHVVLAMIVGLILHVLASDREVKPIVRLAVVLIILLSQISPKPISCSVRRSARALLVDVWRGGEVERTPLGYRQAFFTSYDWSDYRMMLDYIRERTDPDTRVANCVLGLAVTGPTDRLSAFPAESVTWLHIIRKQDEPWFARSLEQTSNSVVVWVPGEEGRLSIHYFAHLTEQIRRLYEPEVRFGSFEIWRRKPPEGR
jgi:hypothetical protein